MREWIPHVTVATVVVRDNSFLMVQERDKRSGELVFNQAAGHLEANESLAEAALRETREETGWNVELTAVLGVALYTAASNGITYHRTTFLAKPLEAIENAPIDPDISSVHWMEYEDILANSARMRSPLVIAAIEQYRCGHIYPMDLIYG